MSWRDDSNGPKPEGDMDETRVYEMPKNASKPRKRKRLKQTGIVVLAILLFMAGTVFGMYSYLKAYSSKYPFSDEDVVAEQASSRINILVIGIDGGVNGNTNLNGKTGTRSDVMMIVSIDPELNKVGVLSIPRDTRVLIPIVNSIEKAGHAHAYGGPELVKATLENLLKIDIHRYVRVDFEGFKKVVDTLGGVYIDVPQDMHYEDPYQDLYIHIEKGPQVLDGQKALEFVRYRGYTNADIGRIEAQHLFIKALADKVMRVATLPKIPQLVSDILPYVLTDLTNEDIMYLASVGLNMSLENVEMDILPGVPGYVGDVSYWLIDSEKAEETVDRILRGIDRTKNVSVKVAVQNGSGISGAADYVASILRSYDFDVVSVEEASRVNYSETRVFAPKDNRDVQIEILRVLKSTSPQVKAYVSDDMPEEVDVLVVIGNDFNRYGQ
ncbi:MAG TPA: LCP family protein [Firmicutes bacterium]|nr:LCP family protein [Candidatus Fermentithermobacillaceae bacterium]